MAEKTANATTRSDAPRGRQQRGSRRDERRNKRDRDDAPKEFEEVVINIDRVARVVKGGRRFRFKALVVVGNRKDKVGVGVAKGQDVQTAISKATDVAKKNLIIIPLYKDTIPHDSKTRTNGAHVSRRSTPTNGKRETPIRPFGHTGGTVPGSATPRRGWMTTISGWAARRLRWCTSRTTG